MKAIVRGDLDGLVSAALLKSIGQIDQIEIVRLKEFLDGKIAVTDQDILCNLPYNPDCYLWFDHHSSEARRTPPVPTNFQGAFSLSPSTAHVIYQYFLPFHTKIERLKNLVDDADTVDTADLSEEDVTHPQGSILLGFLLDPRSRLGDPPELTKRYLAWQAALPDLLVHENVDHILALPETKFWIQRYFENQEAAIKAIYDTTTMKGNIIYSDFRDRTMPPINRFVIYSLPEFESGNISVQISDGEPGIWYEISVGHSIFNRTSMVDVGDLCGWYGGGGHRAVGVCRPSLDDIDQVLEEILHACSEETLSEV